MLYNQLIHKGSANFHFGRHFNQAELRGLKLGQWLSGHPGIPAIIRDPFQNHFRCGNSADSAGQAFLLEFFHEHEKAHAFFSQTVFPGYAAIGEKQLGRVLAPPAHFLKMPAPLEPRGPAFQKIKGYGLIGVFDGRVPGGQHHQIRMHPV